MLKIAKFTVLLFLAFSSIAMETKLPPIRLASLIFSKHLCEVPIIGVGDEENGLSMSEQELMSPCLGEDRGFCFYRDELIFIGVFDGIGGGDQAAARRLIYQLSLGLKQAFFALDLDNLDLTNFDMRERLLEKALASVTPAAEDINAGTTVALLLTSEDTAIYWLMGDSPFYYSYKRDNEIFLSEYVSKSRCYNTPDGIRLIQGEIYANDPFLTGCLKLTRPCTLFLTSDGVSDNLPFLALENENCRHSIEELCIDHFSNGLPTQMVNHACFYGHSQNAPFLNPYHKNLLEILIAIQDGTPIVDTQFGTDADDEQAVDEWLSDYSCRVFEHCQDYDYNRIKKEILPLLIDKVRKSLHQGKCDDCACISISFVPLAPSSLAGAQTPESRH